MFVFLPRLSAIDGFLVRSSSGFQGRFRNLLGLEIFWIGFWVGFYETSLAYFMFMALAAWW